VAKNTGSIFVE